MPKKSVGLGYLKEKELRLFFQCYWLRWVGPSEQIVGRALKPQLGKKLVFVVGSLGLFVFVVF